MDSVLIIEDDIEFVENFNKKLTEVINFLPDNWDALNLGGTDHPNERSVYFNSHLKKCRYTTGAFAILFNCKVIPYLIEKVSEEKKLIDIYYAEEMNKLNWFRTTEKLVIHRAGVSEISGNFVDYKHLR